MDTLLGKWRLIRNDDFNMFLVFTQTSWFERKIAENSNINVEIQRTEQNTYHKSIESLFYNATESITLDNTFRLYDKIEKRYSYKEGIIKTDIIGTIVNWGENIYLNNKNQLVIEYVWTEDDTEKTASQIFEKN